jgi:ABC-type multidrug transport system fused ATPase/permease subunit
MNNYIKLFEILSKTDRKKVLWIVLLVFIMAVFDVIGIASIMPFMAVLANPEFVGSNVYLHSVYVFYEFNDTQGFLFFLGVVVFGVLMFSLVFKAITNYILFKFVLVREYEIGSRLIVSYLGQPYSWFLDRNSAELGKTLLSEVNQVVLNGLLPFMNVVAQSMMVVIIVVFLLFIDFQLALIVGGSLFVAYLVLFKLTGAFLTRIGTARLRANEARFRAVSELFGAIKEVKVAGLESIYINRFRVPSKTYAEHQASAMVVSQLPRFALEGFAFGGLLGVILYLMGGDQGITAMLPIMSAYAFAAYKLMPALQAIYAGVSLVSFSSAAISALHSSLYEKPPCSLEILAETSPVTHHSDIAFQDVSFKYDSADKDALQNINLIIPSGSKVGIVGPSGSGKTTTVDVLLGLLEPQSGSILVDGTIIGPSNRSGWQQSIGYVPQHIYLADDTISANIAFGVNPDQIDFAAVEVAAKLALLHDYIVDDMPLGYKTRVGERGARLSGGQRQRIGIARALYRNPSLLILDEATSALDNLTEKSVMDAVHNIGEMTILMIAHRLSTVRKCDTIVFLNGGVIEGRGTFDELVENNQIFRAMAEQEVKKALD